MAVTKKPKWKPGLVTDPGLPDVAVAVSLGLRLLQEAGCATWAELVGDDPQYREKAMGKVTLSPVQAALLDRHADSLTWIGKFPKPEGGTATSTISMCPTCGEFTIVTGAAPTSCKIKKTCRDVLEAATDPDEKKALKPSKVKAATRQKTPEDPLNEPTGVNPMALAPAVAPAPVAPAATDGRESAEVTSDGLVRAKMITFGDVIEDEFLEDDAPTPAPVVQSPPPPVTPPAVDVVTPAPVETFDVPVDFAHVTEDF